MFTDIKVSKQAMPLFTTGHNIRIRNVDGVISIKPSTRGYGVRGEFSFSTLKIVDGCLKGNFKGEATAGEYGLEKQKYGWFTLVGGTGITLSPNDAEAVHGEAEVVTE
jgi:hypothetical protein